MIVDLLGNTRAKIGLHTHTTVTDGHLDPVDVAKRYVEAGYDAIALTDHWVFHGEDEIEGLKILSGIEYDVGGSDGSNGVFHIVGVGMTSDPDIPTDWRNMVRTSEAKAAEIIKRIGKCNGLAILAHPAWSLNTPAQLLRLGGFDAMEIYNSVSDHGMSDRAYSETMADQLALEGVFPSLVAADDAHYYDGDECRGFIMVETVDMDMQGIVRAIRAGRFYASQGPQVHLIKTAPDKVKVVCSPVSKITFQSNTVWARGRIVRGDGLIEAEYVKAPTDRYVRAEVTDEDGKKAWTCAVLFD